MAMISGYQKEILEIKEGIAKKRTAEIDRFTKELDERLGIEEQKIIEAFNNYWTLKTGAPLPIADKEASFSQNGSQKGISDPNSDGNSDIESKELASRNEKIRDIVKKYSQGAEITSQIVFESFEQQYPDLAEGLADKKTLISKILREMESADELEKIQQGAGASPTIYRKL